MDQQVNDERHPPCADCGAADAGRVRHFGRLVCEWCRDIARAEEREQRALERDL